MKKLFCIFLLLLLFISNYSSSQWSVVSNQGNEAVSFPSVNTGYSTSNGLTRKTTNGGINWSTLSGGNLSGIYFINDLTGWVVGYPGYIGRTTNGGTFISQSTGVTDRLNDVFFINENTGWVVGGDFSIERIFKTTNGGINWVAQTSNTSNKLFSVYFIDEYTGWSVGGPSSAKIIKTTNGGANWFTQTTSATTPLYSVMFADANTGWAVAGYLGGETIIKTTNGGQNWFGQSSGDNRYLRECYVKNANTVVAVGQGGKIISSTNGGNNWIVHVTGSTVELWSVDFGSDTVGYAIGSNIVMKSSNGGVTFISGSANIISGYLLSQNYPNPFNPSTVIRFQVSNGFPIGALGNDQVVLKVYDVMGREVETLVNERLQPGTYEASFDGSILNSGVYFYKITAGNYSETKRMLMVK